MTWVPPNYSSILEGTPIFGTVDAINAMSAFVNDVSLDAWSYKSMVEGADQSLSVMNAVAITKISSKIRDTLAPGAQVLIDTGYAAKSAFDSYASEVDRIHTSARNIRTAINASLDNIRTQSDAITEIARKIRFYGAYYTWNGGAPGQMPEPTLSSQADDLTEAERSGAVQNLRNLYAQQWLYAALQWDQSIQDVNTNKTNWNTLIEERRQAEQQLTTKLGETSIGQLITLAGGSGQTRKSVISYAFSGELWGSTDGALQMNTSHPLLKKLLGTESGANVWNSPPDPIEVAKNWEKLTPAEQQELIRMVPWVIGNLPGLPYSTRDLANNLTLQYYAMNRDSLSANSTLALDQLVKLVAESAGTEPKVMLVAVNLDGDIPMLAVGYGDLDSADNLTWQVPGMDSDAHNALSTWDKASRNLYSEQQGLTAGYGNGSVGVISFLSYDTPGFIGKSGVLEPNQAQGGAPRLAAELDGTWAARNVPLGLEPGGWMIDSPHIAVTAHSYGTTTSANALTQVQHTVDSFSMAGSAGIDKTTVSSLDQLNVAVGMSGEKSIFVSHAVADNLAPVGLHFGGRGNPSPNMHYEGNPTMEGATFYSSDGYTAPDGTRFASTDGHSVIGANSSGMMSDVLQNLGFEAPSGHGYWDTGTQSLRNLAASSLGLDMEIVGGTH